MKAKRSIAFILCLTTVVTLIACNADVAETYPTEEKKDYSEFAGIVADPVTWYEDFQNLPVANADMTTDELRQLAVDAFKADLTFQWTPNESISYTYDLGDAKLPVGTAYSGLCYCTGIRNATFGNLYKVLNFYDPETGVLDVKSMGDNMLGILSSACAYGAQQGWNRVSNSHGLARMESYNMFDSNIVPVGNYTYAPYIYDYNFATKTASLQIIEHNGEEVIYEAYAQMLFGDGLYSSHWWHVGMCAVNPVVVRKADGSIDHDQSYILTLEQCATGTNHPELAQKQSNGVDIRHLGSVELKHTFKELLEMGYIPFTIKEFLGEEPVEPGEAWLGTETTALENGQDFTVSQLFGKSLFTNYALCNLELTVKTPDGKVLFSYDPMIVTAPWTYQVQLSEVTGLPQLTPYANGKNTISIYAQLANGELVEAYKTILKTD